MKEYLLRCLTLVLLTFSLHAAPELPIRLSGHVPNLTKTDAVFLHNLDDSTHVPMTFILPLRNQEALEELVARMYDPADQEFYGKYISLSEFVEKFSPTEEDYDKVISYARSQGFKIRTKHPNRTLLTVVGSAGTIEHAFHLRLREYATATGRKFYAPNNNPQVPAYIASVISGIVGLDNEAEWHPLHQIKETAELESKVFPSGPKGGFSPSNLLTAYNLNSVQATGKGQIIALFELSGYQASDIHAYTEYFNLPKANLHDVIVDGGSNVKNEAEVALDIELALALAPESQIYVYEGPNSNYGVLDTYNRICTDNLAKQVSTSWGLGEDQLSLQYLKAENAIFLQMAAQGQTIYAAAGDSGAYDDYPYKKTLVVDDPASQPYVVGVGGTRLNVNPHTGAYLSESTWNNGLGRGAGGGGVSTVWPIPAWQVNVPTVDSVTHRNVPDVALNADTDTGYAIYFNDRWNIYGGTSCAAPLWAAFTACVNQVREANQQQVLGFANPTIYTIAMGTDYAEDFHDVTNGDNLHYAAKTNYDNATGWGSFNGAHLFASLTTPMQAPAHLNINMKHNAPFPRSKVSAYHIGISNNGNSSTMNRVTVSVNLPRGLNFNSAKAPGWNINGDTVTFTCDDALRPGERYPSIVLYVNVDPQAPYSVTPSATVSGGGSISSTVTNYTTTRKP